MDIWNLARIENPNTRTLNRFARKHITDFPTLVTLAYADCIDYPLWRADVAKVEALVTPLLVGNRPMRGA
jgi:hypothetical protein